MNFIPFICWLSSPVWPHFQHWSPLPQLDIFSFIHYPCYFHLTEFHRNFLPKIYKEKTLFQSTKRKCEMKGTFFFLSQIVTLILLEIKWWTHYIQYCCLLCRAVIQVNGKTFTLFFSFISCPHATQKYMSYIILIHLHVYSETSNHLKILHLLYSWK